MKSKSFSVLVVFLALWAAHSACAAAITCDAALNPLGTRGKPSFCVAGEPAQIAVQLGVPPAKLVQCKWSFVAYGVAPSGKPKTLTLLAGRFTAKYVDGTTPLVFTNDISAKLNKQLAKKGTLKKLPANVNDGALLLSLMAKPAYGLTEKTSAVVNATIYLARLGISGRVTGVVAAGVAMQLTGDASTTTVTSADGAYVIGGLVNGVYFVRPRTSGFRYAPMTQCVTVDAANVSGIDFASAPWTGGDDMMELIPAGEFAMGAHMAGDGWGDGLPVHTVMVSAFYMDKCEVSYTLWTSVYQWAVGNGYAFDHAGAGKATNHPVQTVSWYDCVKWCNARSEMEGLTPCYYTNVAQTLVYRRWQKNLSNEWVNWSANGYRLPTEAEWEKAARGGAVGMRFPWSNVQTISRAQANYYGDTNTYAYDLGPNGRNPLFTPGGSPFTSPVGYFAPNGYGLYDTTGNVWEWCWDWFSSSYYTNSPANDPRGPASSSTSERVLRGGGWGNYADGCRVAIRNDVPPGGADYYLGFRCVRGL